MLDPILCLKTTRVVRRDGMVAHNRQLYRIQANVRATHVMVEDRVDGTMRITHQGQALAYEAIAARPVQVPAPSTVPIPQRRVKPTRDHPWRKRLLPERGQHAAAAGT